MNGLIIVDKPAGWTSHDVVNRMRRILNQRSVGHLGTLDPLATGVLPLVVGNLTRLAQFYTASEKTYEGVIRFGFATTTYDADGDPVSIPAHVGTAAPGCPLLTVDQLQQLATQFVGVITQIPPPFSAKKIHGVPAYKLARNHKEVELKPIEVEIKEFTITSVENDRARFRARVASGTYMRSVAHDLGQRLGCGAHLESLRRTSVAEFDLSQAHTLEEIQAASKKMNGKTSEKTNEKTGCHSEPVRSSGEEPAFRDKKENSLDPCHSERAPAQVNPESSACHPDRSLPFPQEKASVVEGPAVLSPARSDAIAALFIHPRQLLPQFPCVTADEPTAARIRNGRPVNLPELSRARHVKVFANQTELIAIATRVAGSLFHPKIVFPSD